MQRERKIQFKTPIKKRPGEDREDSFKKAVDRLSPFEKFSSPFYLSNQQVRQASMKKYETPLKNQFLNQIFNFNNKDQFEQNSQQLQQQDGSQGDEQEQNKILKQPIQNIFNSNTNRTIQKKTQDNNYRTPKMPHRKIFKSSNTSKRNQKYICCNCKKSRCLKLYCDCFSRGYLCNGCSCVQCLNTHQNSDIRYSAMMSIMQRNDTAFKQKVQSGSDRHSKGCNCRNSRCSKGYCQCFQAGVVCTDLCKCEQCLNTEVRVFEQKRKKRRIQI